MNNQVARSISEFSRILNLLFIDIFEHTYLSSIAPPPLTKMQFNILKILKISGPLLVSEIADFMQISRSAASKNIDKLVNYKLVSRKIITTDRRTASVALLKPGENIVNEFEKLRTKKQDIALAGFTEKEQRQLSKLLGKYVSQCLTQEKELNLICLKCNGSIGDECALANHNVKCRFQFS